jgi:hypothetical protein
MKRVFLVATLISAVACGGGGFERTACSIPCLGPVYSDTETSCDNVLYNHELALAIIESFVPQACSVYEDVPFTIHGDNFQEQVGGYYDAFSGIHVGPYGGAHLHEMFHHWDFVHLAVGTIWHAGWDANGYNAASAVFKTQCRNIGVPLSW